MSTQQVPKTTRGLQYPGYIRVNRRQLKKWMEAGNPFIGFIVGNNVNSFHFFGGWYLACNLESPTWEEFTTSLNSFEFYLDPELGSQAAIFLKKP